VFLNKELFGYLAVVCALSITPYYSYLILKNKIKPHVFSWVIWALIGGIAGAARGAGDAGPGAWGIWAGTFGCIVISVLAFYKGEKNIKRSDMWVFVGALSAIPAWLLTHNPLWAVVIVTMIDVSGYYLTARKSWSKPYEEPVFNYIIANGIELLSLFANDVYSFTTVLQSAVLLVVNTVLITMILYRRRIMAMA